MLIKGRTAIESGYSNRAYLIAKMFPIAGLETKLLYRQTQSDSGVG